MMESILIAMPPSNMSVQCSKTDMSRGMHDLPGVNLCYSSVKSLFTIIW